MLIIGETQMVLNTYVDVLSYCENCHTSNVNYIVKQSYHHVFWIPVYPIMKNTGTYCYECNHSNEVIHSQKSVEYEKITKTPVYMYTLPIVVLVIILLNMFF